MEGKVRAVLRHGALLSRIVLNGGIQERSGRAPMAAQTGATPGRKRVKAKEKERRERLSLPVPR